MSRDVRALALASFMSLSPVVGLYDANSYNPGDNMDFVGPSRDLSFERKNIDIK